MASSSLRPRAKTAIPSEEEADQGLLSQLHLEYLCTICSDVCIQAAVTSCGHKFCKHCINLYIKSWTTCPKCSSQITSTVLVPTVDKAIDSFFKLASKQLRQKRKIGKMERLQHEKEYEENIKKHLEINKKMSDSKTKSSTNSTTAKESLTRKDEMTTKIRVSVSRKKSQNLKLPKLTKMGNNKTTATTVRGRNAANSNVPSNETTDRLKHTSELEVKLFKTYDRIIAAAKIPLSHNSAGTSSTSAAHGGGDNNGESSTTLATTPENNNNKSNDNNQNDDLALREMEATILSIDKMEELMRETQDANQIEQFIAREPAEVDEIKLDADYGAGEGENTEEFKIDEEFDKKFEIQYRKLKERVAKNVMENMTNGSMMLKQKDKRRVNIGKQKVITPIEKKYLKK